MASIVVPKDQAIVRILVVIGVHEFVHALTCLIEIFANVQLRAVDKGQGAREIPLVPGPHVDIQPGFQDKAGRGVLINDPFDLREVGLDHGS